jgi:hypothetical protein
MGSPLRRVRAITRTATAPAAQSMAAIQRAVLPPGNWYHKASAPQPPDSSTSRTISA